MRIFTLVKTGCILAAIAAWPAAMLAKSQSRCESSPVTQESYTWDFKGEAASILRDVRADALKVESQTGELRGFYLNPGIDWQTHANLLAQLKQEINDIGAKLCRLETIRSAESPWEQTATDRTATLAKEMALHTQAALEYLNAHRSLLWSSPEYLHSAENLYAESRKLAETIGDFEKLARIQRQEGNLRTVLHTDSSL